MRKYENVKISELKPYEKNARTHSEEQIKKIADSIKEFGFINPVLIDGDKNIIAGHGRILGAKLLGMDKVPCLYIEDLTEAQKRAYIIADNKLALDAGWDEEILKEELTALNDMDFNIELTGFTLDDLELDEDMEPEEDNFNIDEALAEDSEPIAKLGDIYKLGDHYLMCGDSTSSEDVDRLMDGAKADMVLSDPPYGMCLDTDFSTIKGPMKSLGRKNNTEGNKYEKVIGDNEDFKPELITTFFANFEYVKEMFLFGADYFAELLPDKNKGSWLVWDKRKESQADAIGSEFELIWSRNKHKRRMLRHDWFGFLSSENGADARNRVHPTQKPVTLLVDILNQWGKDANVIIDLYGGSGSTLIACEQLNRKCYMMELDPHYVDVIIKRWEDYTGKKAVKISG